MTRGAASERAFQLTPAQISSIPRFDLEPWEDAAENPEDFVSIRHLVAVKMSTVATDPIVHNAVQNGETDGAAFQRLARE